MENLSKITEVVRARLNPDCSLKHDFKGQCGAAQSMLYYAFQNMGMTFRPLNTQSLSNYYFGHASGVLEDGKAGKTYLVDPTFAQFKHTEYDAIPPADILGSTDEGHLILQSLLKDGYIELTPLRARLYLESFLNGENLSLSDEQAFDFILNPPQNKHHLTFGFPTIQGTPENLQAAGFWLDTQDLN